MSLEKLAVLARHPGMAGAARKLGTFGAAGLWKLPKTMTAQVVSRHGGPDVFKISTIPSPEIRPGHVIIKSLASSVNPVDYKIRAGSSPLLAPDLPAVLHGDVAGVVVEVGEGVLGFKKGDEVYGCAGGFKGNGGALAQYMLADYRLIAHKPTTLDMPHSAALALVGITAYEALFHRARLQPGMSVLIQGAGGGVGHIAVQFAKAAGAKVYATASSPRKLEVAAQSGAIGINYNQMKVQEYVEEHTGGRGFDVVMNTVGGPSLQDAFAACVRNGTVVGISSSGTQYDLGPLHRGGLSLHLVFQPGPLVYNVGREQHGESLKKIATMVDQGSLRPFIDRIFPYSQVGLAHAYLQSGQAIGKVALEQDLTEEVPSMHCS